jgi:sugar lactone lactonase YvrE
MEATVLCKSECILGEGPLWLPGTQKLMWVDIERSRLYEHDWRQRTARHWQLDKRVTLVLPLQQSGQLLIGMQGGAAIFDPANGQYQWLADIEKEMPTHRCNDGAFDAQGRLWAGSMCTSLQPGQGSLYMLGKDLSLHKKISRLAIPNGIVWSRDNTRMYFIDSNQRCVQCYRFDAETGDITFEKVAVDIPPLMGSPDGMTMDEEGMLWIAHYGGYGVYRWNPLTGELLEKVSLPVPNVTSCVFGGPDLDVLFITTARQELGEDALRQYPDSGNVFYVQTKVKGLPTNAGAFGAPGGAAVQALLRTGV